MTRAARAAAHGDLFDCRQYKIRTVADFLSVPLSRRRACLREFRLWLDIHADVLTLLTPPDHPNSVTTKNVFIWTDDHQRYVQIRLTQRRKVAQ